MKTKVLQMGWVGLGLGLAHMATACSSDPPGAVSAQGGAGGVPSAGTGSRFGNMGGKLSSAGMAGVGSVAQPPMCRKTSDIDAPDGEFTDANCDGIDGDKAKGIFVSPNGLDTASGTFGAPVKTIAKGVALGIAAKKDVYVCQGEYAENLVIEGSVSLGVYGGYACADWKRSNQRAVVNPAAGVPLRVKSVQGELVVDRLEFSAPDAKEASGSSIAAWVTSSKHVFFRQVDLRAGKGASGSVGTTPAAVLTAPPQAPKGEDSPANSVLCGCATTEPLCFQSIGFTSMSGTCDAPGGLQAVYIGRGGDGANLKSCYVAGNPLGGSGLPGLADDGTIGQAGTPGTPGQGIGTFGEAGYVPSNIGVVGGIAFPGKSGRGGTGGGSTVVVSNSNGFPAYWTTGGRGGYGGLPGCGGNGGDPGTAGGASIGLLSWESEVNLEWSSVKAQDGGKGGNGIQGAVGQPGGMGGPPGLYGGIAGQKGGNGGKGGDGGPGGGGPALGIAAVGIAPVLTAVSFDVGRGGLGGKSVANSVVPDAASGISADYWPVDIRPVANGAAGAAGMAGKGGI